MVGLGIAAITGAFGGGSDSPALPPGTNETGDNNSGDEDGTDAGGDTDGGGGENSDATAEAADSSGDGSGSIDPIDEIESQPHLVLIPDLSDVAEDDVEAVWDQTMETVRSRASVAGLSGEDLLRFDDVVLIALGDNSAEDLRRILERRTTLEFRPICDSFLNSDEPEARKAPSLPTGGCDAVGADLADTLRSTTPSPTPAADQRPEQLVLAADETELLLLGPAVSGEGAINSSSAEVGEIVPDQWLVNIGLSEGAEKRLINELFATCFEAQPTCPMQRLAILADGEVVIAPSVQIPSADGVQLSGDFDAVEAKSLAASLSSNFPTEFEITVNN